MSNDIDATYSAEDNKLRLYPAYRLDDETYKRVRELGFRWAPKQELFVAPKWTPAREDLCTELAGDITAEQSTLVERAKMKAERLDALAAIRGSEANSFHEAAQRIAERFAGGQPILVGHHSERKARRDRAKMDAAMGKAEKAAKAVQYWNWRAACVERHVNRKADPGVRMRRIKTLLAELRDRQRDINHAFICLKLWEDIKAKSERQNFDEIAKYYAGAYLTTGSAAPDYQGVSLWSQLDEGTITAAEAVEICLSHHRSRANSRATMRWISHILNRLAYERSELGPVARFEGEITPVILQAFAREHGAVKPKASRSEAGFKLVSAVPLPLHIAEGKEVDLTEALWRIVMQSAGYEVPAPKAKVPPIRNFRAESIASARHGDVNWYPQVEMTKAEYAAMHPDYRGVQRASCGTFRFKSCMRRNPADGRRGLVSVFLTDSKTHDVPESNAIRQGTSEVSS